MHHDLQYVKQTLNTRYSTNWRYDYSEGSKTILKWSSYLLHMAKAAWIN